MSADQTTIAGPSPISDEGRAVKARLVFDRRMGVSVDGESIVVLFGSQMLVGREDGADITIKKDRISRKHALIRIEGNEARLSDLGSTNGTTRNGTPATEEIIIESGDIITFGQAESYEARVVHREGHISSVRLASGSRGFLLVPQEFIIGSVQEDNHDVDLRIYDPSILPRHIRMEFFTGQCFVVSLNPDKPAVVNSSPVREIEIRNDYLIELGDTLIRYERLG